MKDYSKASSMLNELKQEILKADLALLNDKRYREEEYPVQLFREFSQRDLGIVVNQFEANQNDPPDFFAQIDNINVNLEITTLKNEEISKRNEFIRKIQQLSEPIIERHRSELPVGYYEFRFFPGSLVETKVLGLKIDVPQFRDQAGNELLKKEIESKLPEKIREIARKASNNIPVDLETIRIEGRKGTITGEIRISKYESDRTECFFRLNAMMSTPPSEEAFRIAIQDSVSKKERKYKTRAVEIFPWWLLISDINNDFGTENLKFDPTMIGIVSSFFQRVFFIRRMTPTYRIIEICRLKDKESCPVNQVA